MSIFLARVIDTRIRCGRYDPMGIGDYYVVIEDERGHPDREIEITTRVGRPHAGEDIEIGGEVYWIRRVIHGVETPGNTAQPFSVPRLYVRRNPRLRIADGPDDCAEGIPDADHPDGWLHRTATGDAQRVQCALLPANLAAALVACGYRAEVDRLRRAARQRGPSAIDPAERDRRMKDAEAGYAMALARIQTLVECALPTFILNDRTQVSPSEDLHSEASPPASGGPAARAASGR